MPTAWDPVETDVARESSRRVIAVLVMAIFALSVLGGFLTLWWIDEGDLGERADVALRIGAPVVVIVGTVLGFYFGRESD